MTAPQAIVDLVETFDRNIGSLKSGRYNETQLRQEFINPFFKGLGWDVYNEHGRLGLNREVVHEDSVRVRETTEDPRLPEIRKSIKNPDYGFYIGDDLKFFIEAKKPSVNLENNVRAAFQLRSYGWSAELPISLLTDFEEFAIYNCQIEPKNIDSPRVGLLRHFTYDKYIDHWDEIYALFSKEAVANGSLERYIASKKKTRGTIAVGDAFLRDIDHWREIIAKNLHKNNPDLSIRELNSSVQNTIDRIVFLRICEDRGIERFGQLQDRLNGEKTIYARLVALFKDADDKYNSGLFHFREEPGRGEPDILTPSLKIDDVVLREMIENLYPPVSPYRFSVIPAEILGHVYEQFLGKVISPDDDGDVEVEYKPEVRKAGGVYYTPTYIVDYIVENTVGKLLEGQTPNAASDFRILDPACGSGSFLIGAYQRLLDWHLEWYANHLAPLLEAGKAETSKEVRIRLPASYVSGNSDQFPISPARGRGWRLTTAERKRILLNNIYGVDIDPQAVEVTKLSLNLKVLEGESKETLPKQQTISKERVLPDLGKNIKCGNSLIGWDILEANPGMTEAEISRINPFDWEREFPDIMSRGGFDAVIGNPPYIRIQRIGHNEADYIFHNYETPTSKTDLSQIFLEHSLKIINKSGRAGFICTSQWMSTDYGKNMRLALSDGILHEIIDFGSLPVFQKASTYPAIFILSLARASALRYICIQNADQLNPQSIKNAQIQTIGFDSLSADPWNLGSFDIHNSLDSRKIKWHNLREFGQAYIGVLTGMDAAFVVNRDTALHLKLERDLLLPYAYRGNEITRYSDVRPNAWVIYPYAEEPNGSPRIITESDLKSNFPNIFNHLKTYEAKLRERKDSRKFYALGSDWYRHLRPGSFNYIHPKKFIIKGIDKIVKIGLLEDKTAFNGANCPGIILDNLQNHSELYVLGILNSKVVSYHLKMVCPAKLGGYTRFNANNINNTPIRTIDSSDPQDTARHDQMVSLVERMLDLHKRLAETKAGHEKTLLQRQIEATDKQIDRLVYELYGLTEEEIKIVEEATT